MSQNTLQKPHDTIIRKPSRSIMDVVFGHDAFKYWALVPLMLFLLVFTVMPILELFRLSVSEIQFAEGELVREFVGMQHFETMRTDFLVPIAITNTLIYVVAAVLIETVLGFALALAVSRTQVLAVLYRSVVIIPLLIPPVAIGTMWGLMYDFNYGIITQVLIGLGVDNPPLWTADPNLALISVIIVDVWHWTSFMFLIMLAGVESLPQELMEAARVDGASERQTLRFVILPLMAPTIIVAMMLRTILAFKVFDQIFVLTTGGPGTATQVISMYIYKVFSEQARLGYAGFLSLAVAVIMTVFVIFYLWLNSMAQRRM